MYTFAILTVDKRGKYLNMNPDLEQGVLVSTNILLNGYEFRPFGFAKNYSGNTLNYPNDLEETKEKARLEAFSKFIDTLKNEVDDSVAPDLGYILVEIKKNKNAGMYWHFSAEYQFMLRD